MVFGPWIEAFVWIKGALPDWSGGFKFKIPHVKFNYIMLHYTYILAMTLLGSVIIFAAGNMAYIDALFFASGTATQSGLNTIDVNKLYLYQQVVIMLFACCCTPTFINTMVVFVRLYWFEKRFQHVVLEAQKYRRTKDKSRSRSQMKENDHPDMEQEERGVGARKIVVMHPGERTMSVAEHHLPGKTEKDPDSEDTSAQSSSMGTLPDTRDHSVEEEGVLPRPDTSQALRPEDDPALEPKSARPNRAITFADETDTNPRSMAPARARSDSEDHYPTLRSPDQHVSFLMRQRQQSKDRPLFIPGPRDFDKGLGPEEIEDEDDIVPSRSHTKNGMALARRGSDLSEAGGESGRDTFREKVTKKLSLEDAGQAFQKAKLGVMTRLRHPAQSDGLEEEDEDVGFPPSSAHPTNEISSPTSLRRRGRATTFASFLTTRQEDPDPMPYLSYQATLGRNSAFVDLTEEQREELGGIEYRSLKTLAVILVSYFVGFHLLGMVCLTPWIVHSQHYSNVVRDIGANPVWWGFFTPASLFNDLGLTLTPDSMISFQHAVFPLLLGSFLIVIGNTGFPCMLRFIIWTLSKITPRSSSIWEEYRFLLDHPRRCFTLLFPSNANWWLFWILVILNGVDLILFIILDLGDPTVTDLPAGIQVLSGWFQATSTRTAGFAVINLADLHPGVQVSYLIMMYISVLPIAISIRNTNVYEEKSLGVSQPETNNDDDNAPAKSFISNHLRRQLSFDLWYVFLGLFLITIIEGTRIENTNEYAFTTFSVLFEVVSAYGTVGLSLGYPGVNTSFSGQFHALSKLVIIAMQIRGRHRGLPYALDKAILLPSEELRRKEAEDADRRAQARRDSIAIQNVRSNETTGEKDDEGPPSIGLPRTQTGRSSISQGGTRRKKNNIARLVGQVFTAGPVHKDD